MEDFTDVKLEIFVPQEHALQLRDELARIGVGVIGNYDYCAALTAVHGFFRPLPGSNPAEGEMAKVNEVAEYKLEARCRRELVKEVIKVIPLGNHLFE